ncbi:hypothetical protein IQ289_31660 [Burkholderia sp. R-70006]|uniref:hypothetical protein n=1 Tax=Paraburkholderia domus TaxID=2793075 RepID=UPI0019146AAF|nr:hypothetical protein [Paraburkholderia domus]MBK5052943.1 hypothetical protein [Burkholderia sp. R-70006]
MANLYWQGKARKLTSTVADVAPCIVTIPPGLNVDWLVNEHCDTLVIEGHVDLAVAAEAMRLEGSIGFPAPRHAWMRDMTAPENEPLEAGDRYGWRGECERGARGAEPVTIAVRPT